MTQNAILSYGTLLKVGDGASPEVFATIAECRDFNGPQMTADTEDVTTHDSGSPWIQPVTTFLHGGTIEFTINFIPTNATHSYSTGLAKVFSGREKHNYKLVFTDSGNTSWVFLGVITRFHLHAPVKQVLTADIAVTVVGAPTFA